MTDITITARPTVDLINYTGGDEMVLASMLVSTKGAESVKELTSDPEAGAGRINFLMRNRHGTPFEHNQFTFYIRAGIFVFREFHRHRIGWSYNEESGRYKQLDPVFYVPGPYRPLKQVGKPGAYEMVPAPELNELVVEELCDIYQECYQTYELLIARGVAKEVARLCLPVGINSSMYATCNARSLMSFLALRTYEEEATFPSHPQYEIEQVAVMMEAYFREMMPITYKAWVANGRVAP